MRQAHSLCCSLRGMNAESAIRLSGRKGVDTKTGILTLQDTRLPCNKRMAYAAVGGRIGAEPTIRFSGQKGVDTKTSTLILQDTRLPCNKRMVYAAVRGGLDAELRLDSLVRRGLDAESATRLSGRKDSIPKRASRLCRMPDCYATSAWPMLQSEGG